VPPVVAAASSSAIPVWAVQVAGLHHVQDAAIYRFSALDSKIRDLGSLALIKRRPEMSS
jgi:hypothetical protein